MYTEEKVNYKKTLVSGTNEVEILNLPNGKTATLLVPEANQDQELSVVDTEVLRYLISNLPKSPKSQVDQIKKHIIIGVQESKNLYELCDLLQKEVNFYKSVNMIESFFLSNPT